MTPSAIVSQIVEILTSGLTAFAQGIGGGIQAAVQNMFFTTTGTGNDATTSLSIYAIMVLVFAGVALATGLTRLIFNWLGSLGGSN